jgi:hypothetical protein
VRKPNKHGTTRLSRTLLVVFNDIACCSRPAYLHEVLFPLSPSCSYYSHAVLASVSQVMHAAAYHTQPPPAAQAHADPLYASVGHLLSKACSNTCFTAAQAFAQLVQPNARFQLALDALLPILDSPRSEVSDVLGPRCIIAGTLICYSCCDPSSRNEYLWHIYSIPYTHHIQSLLILSSLFYMIPSPKNAMPQFS